MMQRNIVFLFALLAAQVVLAVGVSLTDPDLSESRPDAELVSLDTEAVNRIRIEGADGAEVVLARGEGGGWVLPNENGFPAAEMNVSRLLNSLGDLQRGFAVATSSSARSRLKVAEEDFERRLTFFDGDTELETLYLGTSAGANQVHARTGDDEPVYLVDFGAFNAPASSSDWQDKTTLRVPRDEIDALQVAGLSLNRVVPDDSGDASGGASDGDAGGRASGDSQAASAQTASQGAGGDTPSGAGDARWMLEDGPADATVRQGNVDSLAIQLAQLTTGAVLGTEARDSYGLDEPELELTIVRNDGEQVELTLASRADADSYVLKSSARPEYFEYRTTRGDQLANAASRSQLLDLPGEQSSGAQGDTAAAGGGEDGNGGQGGAAAGGSPSQ